MYAPISVPDTLFPNENVPPPKEARKPSRKRCLESKTPTFSTIFLLKKIIKEKYILMFHQKIKTYHQFKVVENRRKASPFCACQH